MHLRARWLATPCAGLPLLFSVIRSAVAQPAWLIHDAGQPRVFELATNELSVADKTGRRAARPVTSAASLDDLRVRAKQWTRTTGEETDLVLYERGVERSVYTRRIVTRKVLVRASADADLAAPTAAAGGVRFEAFDPAPGYFIVEADGPGDALDLAGRLRRLPGVLEAEPMLARQQRKRWTPNDTLYGQQWHLRNTGQGGGTAGIDVNITNVWDTHRGGGILIGIVDDGLQTGHTDLWQNVNTALDWDFNGNDADPNPNLLYDDHGTACSGVAAARGNNARGVGGAAPEATLVGYRLIGGEADDAMEAAAMATNNHLVHIKSNSWGPDDNGRTLEGPGPLTRAAISNAAAQGRGGRGAILVWAGGNGLTADDNANYDGYANSIYTLAIAAITDGGTQAYYSEPGACLVAAAPSSGGATDIVTTDLMGEYGYNYTGAFGELEDRNYTKTFGGTSSAAPLAAGVIALMLQANTNLGWRDVQEILIRSATRNHASDTDWRTNSAGFAFNHKYGAGMINARAAVSAALSWTNLGAALRVGATHTNLSVVIPDNNAEGITRAFDFTSAALRVEHVTVTLDIRHLNRGHLAVTLTSPSGMESRLAEKHSDSGDHYAAWTFGSVRHWGEAAQGTWSLKVADLTASTIGTMRWARVELHGTALEAAPIISSFAVPAGATASTTLNSVNGRSYSLEYTTDLRAALVVWNKIATAIGHGGVLTLFDPDPADAMRFYRVVTP